MKSSGRIRLLKFTTVTYGSARCVGQRAVRFAEIQARRRLRGALMSVLSKTGLVQCSTRALRPEEAVESVCALRHGTSQLTASPAAAGRAFLPFARSEGRRVGTEGVGRV